MIIVLYVPRLMSSVHEMDCLGKETGSAFWCSELYSVNQTVTVLKRVCAGCEGSRVILLSLDEHSSWRVGRVVPGI